MKVKSPSKIKLSAKQKLRLTFLFAGIMCAGLFVFSIITPKANTKDPGNSKKATHTPTPTATITPTATCTPTPTPTNTPTPTPVIPLLENEDEEIDTLVKAYFDAKLSGNKEDFRNIVSNYDIIDYDLMQTEYQYIVKFDNFHIYSKKGETGSELEYILFVSYDLTILTIDVPVPELTRLVVLRTEPDENDETHLVIDTDSLNDTQQAYVTDAMTHADVIKLLSDEQVRMQNALDANEALKSIWDKLHPAPTPTPEPTEEPTPTPSAEPSPTGTQAPSGTPAPTGTSAPTKAPTPTPKK